MKELKTTVKRRLKTTPSIGILLLSIILFQNITIAQNTNSGKTLLAVFAHPDDEGTIAPLIVKYVEQGVKVQLVIVTDCRYGTNDHTDHEAGEGLVAIRREEMKCAASILGVELTHLDYHDQLKSGEGYDGHIPHVRSLIKEIYGIFEKVKPDVIITWGPDGGSNHMDHRLVGATVTQVFVSKVWDKSPKLYYQGTPSNFIDNPESKILRGQDKKYLLTHVAFTNEDLKTAYNSMICHKSQIRQTTFEAYKERKTKNGMDIYLRKFESTNKVSNTVFE